MVKRASDDPQVRKEDYERQEQGITAMDIGQPPLEGQVEGNTSGMRNLMSCFRCQRDFTASLRKPHMLVPCDHTVSELIPHVSMET